MDVGCPSIRRHQLLRGHQEFGGEPVRLAFQRVLPAAMEPARRLDHPGSARKHGVHVAVHMIVPEFVRHGEPPVPDRRAGVRHDDTEPVALLPERSVDPGEERLFLDDETLLAGDPDGVDRGAGDAQVGEQVGGVLADLALARVHPFFFGLSRSSSASTTRTAWSMEVIPHTVASSYSRTSTSAGRLHSAASTRIMARERGRRRRRTSEACDCEPMSAARSFCRSPRASMT